MKKFEIWCEGFNIQGNCGGANLLGFGVGNDFDEAVLDFIDKNSVDEKTGVKIHKVTREQYLSDEAYENRKSNWTYWGCGLFDNEADARK